MPPSVETIASPSGPLAVELGGAIPGQAEAAGATPPAPSGRQPLGPSRKGAKDMVIERFEQKFIIHPRLVPQIRHYLEPFVVPDPNGKGDIPEYITTTLQLDRPTMDLALAKERKAFARFKLRIRTYGTDSNPKNPVFFELKRKVGVVIIKSRARMSRGKYGPNIVPHPETAPMLKSPKENNNLLEFCRIANTIGAAELATVWTDPAFKADQAAVYYVRVLEIPTPRWTVYDAKVFGTTPPKEAPTAIQDRAYTSPVWVNSL